MVLKHLGVLFSVEFVLVSVRKANLFEGKLSLILDALFWSRAADPLVFPGSKCCLLYVESSRMCCQPAKVLAVTSPAS